MFYYYNDIGNNLTSNNKTYSDLTLPSDILRVARFTLVTSGISLEHLFALLLLGAFPGVMP